MSIIFSNGGLAFRSVRLQLARIPEVLLRLNELQSELKGKGPGLVEWFVATPTESFLPHTALVQAVSVMTQVALFDRYKLCAHNRGPEFCVAEGLGVWALQIIQHKKKVLDLAQALHKANHYEASLQSFKSCLSCVVGAAEGTSWATSLEEAISQSPSQKWVYMGVEDLNCRRLRMQLPSHIEVVDILKTDNQLRWFWPGLYHANRPLSKTYSVH